MTGELRREGVSTWRENIHIFEETQSSMKMRVPRSILETA